MRVVQHVRGRDTRGVRALGSSPGGSCVPGLGKPSGAPEQALSADVTRVFLISVRLLCAFVQVLQCCVFSVVRLFVALLFPFFFFFLHCVPPRRV